MPGVAMVSRCASSLSSWRSRPARRSCAPMDGQSPDTEAMTAEPCSWRGCPDDASPDISPPRRIPILECASHRDSLRRPSPRRARCRAHHRLADHRRDSAELNRTTPAIPRVFPGSLGAQACPYSYYSLYNIERDIYMRELHVSPFAALAYSQLGTHPNLNTLSPPRPDARENHSHMASRTAIVLG